MERIAQVEQKIIADQGNDNEAAERILWPSQYLMKNYSPLNMDENSSLNIKDFELTSPDLGDLQKRFEMLHSDETDETSEDNEDAEIELPGHLQKLVDQALEKLE